MTNDLSLLAANSFTPPFLPLDLGNHMRTVARGVNNAGVVVGTYTDEAGDQHGFRRNLSRTPDHGNVDTFDYPHGTRTVAAGVNDDGYIVGFYVGPDGGEYGYRLDAAAFQGGQEGKYWAGSSNQIPDQFFHQVDLAGQIPELDAIVKAEKKKGGNVRVGTNAQCINKNNHIGGRVFVGTIGQTFPNGSRNPRGFVLTGGDAGKAWTKVYRVDAFPGNMTEVYGININDDVVGSTAKEDPVTGQPDLTNVDSFMQTDAVNLPSTQLSNFPAPAYFSRAWGITDAQKIVGDCNFEGAPDNHYGFVRDQTASPLLDYIEMFTPVGTGSLWSGEFTAANSTFAQGINQLSTLIIGQFTDNHGDIHGFVLSWIVWSAWRLWINQRFPPQRMTTKI